MNNEENNPQNVIEKSLCQLAINWFDKIIATYKQWDYHIAFAILIT